MQKIEWETRREEWRWLKRRVDTRHSIEEERNQSVVNHLTSEKNKQRKSTWEIEFRVWLANRDEHSEDRSNTGRATIKPIITTKVTEDAGKNVTITASALRHH